MPDQRSLLLGRLATAIDEVTGVASQLGPPATQATAPRPPSPPLESVGRPWTLAAAMEPISPTIVEGDASPRSTASGRSLGPLPPEHHRSRVPAALIGSSFLVLIAVIVVHLLSGGVAVQAPTHTIGPISLTGVRPVASAPAGGAIPITQVSFPAKTSVVDIEVNSGGAAGQEPVQVVVTVGQPAQTIIGNAYVLSQSGDTVIPLTAPGGVFAPGNYAVTITYQGAPVGSTAFAVH